jgi:Peptidase family M48
VVNNLELTNNIDLAVRTRVLLTAPLETFSVGNTIVISRGLVDVLPDEASLAAMLAHELAHIVLGHNLGNRFAFRDEANLALALAHGLAHIMSRHKLGSDYEFNDDPTYQDIMFKHSPEEEQAADKEAIELLKNSPYAQKLDNLGLFLKALQLRAPQLTALLATHLGNPLAEGGTVNRLSALANQGPALDNTKLDQIAALPLGGRVKVNPWDDTAEMLKVTPVAITSARDKMPFEVTPFYPRLARYSVPNPPAATTASAPAQASTTANADPAPSN